ncbi:Kinesin [Entamoeba marina]
MQRCLRILPSLALENTNNTLQYDNQTYSVDMIFNKETQESFYEQTLGGVIPKVIEGTDAYIICYGGSHSGKTFTVEGNFTTINMNGAGLIPRTITGLLQSLRGKAKYTVRATFVSIGEEITDLLSDSNTKVILREQTKKYHNQLGGVIYQCATEMTLTENNTSQVLSKVNVLRKPITRDEMIRISKTCRVFSMNVVSSGEEKRGQKEMINHGRITLIDLPGCGGVGGEGHPLNALNNYVEASKENRMRISRKSNPITRVLQEALGGAGYLVAVGCIGNDVTENNQTLKFIHKLKSLRNSPVYQRLIARNQYDAALDEEIKQLQFQYSDMIRKNMVSKEVATAKKLQQTIQDTNYQTVQIKTAIQRIKNESAPEYQEITQKIKSANQYISQKKQTEIELHQKITEMLSIAYQIQEHNDKLQQVIASQYVDTNTQQTEMLSNLSSSTLPVHSLEMLCEKNTEQITNILTQINQCLSSENLTNVVIPRYSSLEEIKQLLQSIVDAFRSDGKRTAGVIDSILSQHNQQLEEFKQIVDVVIGELDRCNNEWNKQEDNLLQNIDTIINSVQKLRNQMAIEIKDEAKRAQVVCRESRTNNKKLVKKVSDIFPQLQTELDEVFKKYHTQLIETFNSNHQFYEPPQLSLQPIISFTSSVKEQIGKIQEELAQQLDLNSTTKLKEINEFENTLHNKQPLDTFGIDAFKTAIVKAMKVIQEIFDETGIINHLKEQCRKLEKDDVALKNQHQPVIQYLKTAIQMMTTWSDELNVAFSNFIQRIDQLTIDFDSECIVERIQSPTIPSILRETSEVPTFLEEFDISTLVKK